MAGESLELTDRTEAVESILRMNEDDLRFLNRVIVERLRLMHQARNAVMLARFSVGDRVSFQTSFGELKAGVIIRLNKKTASIVTDEGQRWNVHPGFLGPADVASMEQHRDAR